LRPNLAKPVEQKDLSAAKPQPESLWSKSEVRNQKHQCQKPARARCLSLSDFAFLNLPFFSNRAQNGRKFMNREICEIREKDPLRAFRAFSVFRGLSAPSLLNLFRISDFGFRIWTPGSLQTCWPIAVQQLGFHHFSSVPPLG
jgi:hypothetical protein